jgi:acetyltransferase-like isoleucine patch superfamily enzyme
MGKGVRLKLFNNSVLVIGNHFSSNANLLISCAKKITFGEDCLLGWNITIMDNDGGHIVIDRIHSQNSINKKEIVIANHYLCLTYNNNIPY